MGGALFMAAVVANFGTLTLTNSTISGNTGYVRRWRRGELRHPHPDQ